MFIIRGVVRVKHTVYLVVVQKETLGYRGRTPLERGICHGDHWYRYSPIICYTEEYVYSEGLVRLVQLSPNIPEGSRSRTRPFHPTMLILDT